MHPSLDIAAEIVWVFSSGLSESWKVHRASQERSKRNQVECLAQGVMKRNFTTGCHFTPPGKEVPNVLRTKC